MNLKSKSHLCFPCGLLESQEELIGEEKTTKSPSGREESLEQMVLEIYALDRKKKKPLINFELFRS